MLSRSSPLRVDGGERKSERSERVPNVHIVLFVIHIIILPVHLESDEWGRHGVVHGGGREGGVELRAFV